MTDRSARWCAAIGLTVVMGGMIALSQLTGPAPRPSDQSPPREGWVDQNRANQSPSREGWVASSAPVLPPPSPDELLAALLAGVDLQPPGLLLIGELCNGMQVWADPDHADQVRILNERVYSVEGTTLGFVPAHVRACDRNGDGLIDGLDLQPFVTEVLP